MMRKPDIEFYELVLDENDLKPQETVFIDDSEQNLPPARELGINTILLGKNTDVSDLFKNGRLMPIYNDDELKIEDPLFTFNVN